MIPQLARASSEPVGARRPGPHERRRRHAALASRVSASTGRSRGRCSVCCRRLLMPTASRALVPGHHRGRAASGVLRRAPPHARGGGGVPTTPRCSFWPAPSVKRWRRRSSRRSRVRCEDRPSGRTSTVPAWSSRPRTATIGGRCDVTRACTKRGCGSGACSSTAVDAEEAAGELRAALAAPLEPVIEYLAALFLGSALEATGRLADARDAYRRAAALTPAAPRAASRSGPRGARAR